MLLAQVAFAAAGPADEPQPDSEYRTAIEHSRAVMRELVERRGVPGASIAVAVDGKVVWTEGFGMADLELKVPATARTRFGIGSVTKSLTTALFARVAETGRVNWDSPVSESLSEFPHKHAGITPRIIASHLSGMGDDFDSAHRYTTQHFTTSEALLQIARSPLRRPPQTEFYYATGTYTVLAAALEKATGKGFRELMKAELLDPLEMVSVVPNEPSGSPQRASFYEETPAGAVVKAPPYDPSYKLAGAGYLSTAEDMARFGVALLQHRRLGKVATGHLFQPAKTLSGEEPITGTGELMGLKDVGIGLGWNIAVDAAGRRVYHQPGGGPGISCWLVLYPEQKLVIAILSNLTGAPVGGRVMRTTVAEFLAAREKLHQPPLPKPAPQALLQ